MLPSFDWEEPHPGRRLFCPDTDRALSNGPDADQGQRHCESDGDGTVGNPIVIDSPQQPPVEVVMEETIIQKQELPPVIIPVTVEPMTAVSDVVLISPDTDSAVSATVSDAPSSSITCQTLEVDADWDKMMLDASPPMSPPVDTPMSPVTPYTDLSNYFDWSPGADEPAPAITIVNPEVYCHAAPTEDLYGWNAEWDRRITTTTTSIPSDSRESTGAHRDTAHPYRRVQTTSIKGSLLHRVFSVGKTNTPASNRRSRFMP